MLLCLGSPLGVSCLQLDKTFKMSQFYLINIIIYISHCSLPLSRLQKLTFLLNHFPNWLLAGLKKQQQRNKNTSEHTANARKKLQE